MASEEDFSYSSSLQGIQGALVLAMGVVAVFLFQGIRILFHPLTDLQGPLAAGRIGIALMVAALLGYICWSERGKKVSISRTKVVCEQGGHSFTIHKSELVLHLPKKGQKTNRSIMVSNGRQSLRINERYFPDFEAILDDLKEFKSK